MTKRTVAAVQIGSHLFELKKSIDKFADWLGKAKNEGIELAVFPEAYLGGYPKGIDFGARVGLRQPHGRDQFVTYYDGAIERNSPEMTRVQSIIKDVGIFVVLGLIERDGGTLYCASAVFDPNGEIVTWHRKLMPTAMERIIWGFGDGSTMEVADTDIGKLSMAICWENYLPLYRNHLYSQNAQIHCVPTVDDRDVWLPSMQMIALEGRCFVVSACQYMTNAHVSDPTFKPLQGDDPDTVLIRGGSCIISPMGDALAAPVFDTEALVKAEIDLDDIPRGKFDLDVAGHYGRPDIFDVIVNTKGS